MFFMSRSNATAREVLRPRFSSSYSAIFEDDDDFHRKGSKEEGWTTTSLRKEHPASSTRCGCNCRR